MIFTHFLRHLYDFCRIYFLTGGPKLPFPKHFSDVIVCFTAVSYHELIKIRDRFITHFSIRLNKSSGCFSALSRWSSDDFLYIHAFLLRYNSSMLFTVNGKTVLGVTSYKLVVIKRSVYHILYITLFSYM